MINVSCRSRRSQTSVWLCARWREDEVRRWSRRGRYTKRWRTNTEIEHLLVKYSPSSMTSTFNLCMCVCVCRCLCNHSRYQLIEDPARCSCRAESSSEARALVWDQLRPMRLGARGCCCCRFREPVIVAWELHLSPTLARDAPAVAVGRRLDRAWVRLNSDHVQRQKRRCMASFSSEDMSAVLWLHLKVLCLRQRWLCPTIASSSPTAFYKYSSKTLQSLHQLIIQYEITLWHIDPVVSTLTSQQGSASPCTCVGSLQVLRLPPAVQRHAG